MKMWQKMMGVAFFSVGAMPVMAAPGHLQEAPVLQQGVSATQQLRGVPERYQVPVAEEGTLVISSEHLASDSSQSMSIEGRLYSPAGELVASDTDSNGHFLLKTPVTSGNYELEVRGSVLGSANESSGRYSLHIGLE
ncbi:MULTISPECIES: hypothetical protein [Halomonas]|uniref:hypothetical protein n=1 Tax=Halomonas TaxID=2745 RepID=UPI001A8E65BF|nr:MULTISPECIES: hypothetical protein [Halomonas]MBN8413104.1 hypothetical protein [Halomonas litopenaei]MBY5928492.1 hypothetical protein [Halomonas sp. DP8Y7-3]MBY5966978.1 hypothetical protein [Halomonas denitrificans]